MKHPFFSVITPSYNQGEFIGECLRSVAAQGDADYEHLIFDNCSEDQTAEVVGQFTGVDFRVERDRGQSDAVNKGLAASRGEVVCWLNSDDAYPPGIFKKLREAFADPSCMIVYGDVSQVSYDGQPPQTAEAYFSERLDLVRWWTSRARLHQPAVFFRRAVYETCGPLREDLHYAMDYEYWWRISEAFAFRKIPGILAIQYRQPLSKTMMSWHKVYADREKIFAPYYPLIDGGNPSALLAEKRRGLSEKYLSEAFAAGSTNPGLAWQSYRRALREHPPTALRPSALGLFRKMLGL